MAHKNLIPHIDLFGQCTGAVASLNEVKDRYVSSHIIHNDGMPIPFVAELEGAESFKVGPRRFYFRNWTKLK